MDSKILYLCADFSIEKDEGKKFNIDMEWYKKVVNMEKINIGFYQGKIN